MRLKPEFVVYFGSPSSQTARADEIQELCEQIIGGLGNVEITTVGYVNGYEVEILLYNANHTQADELESALYRAGYNVEYA